MSMTQRERFLRTLRYEETDRPPLYLAGPWQETLERWRSEGLPNEVKDVHDYLGTKDYGYRMSNITPAAGPFPKFERKTVRETEEEIFYIDGFIESQGFCTMAEVAGGFAGLDADQQLLARIVAVGGGVLLVVNLPRGVLGGAVPTCLRRVQRLKKR